MKIIVLKFGGTSVGTLDRIVKISKIIVSYIKKKYKVIVVTSAMSGVTNELIKKAGKISKKFLKIFQTLREMCCYQLVNKWLVL